MLSTGGADSRTRSSRASSAARLACTSRARSYDLLPNPQPAHHGRLLPKASVCMLVSLLIWPLSGCSDIPWRPLSPDIVHHHAHAPEH